jgi:polyisoprenoid-binding protein YceI
METLQASSSVETLERKSVWKLDKQNAKIGFSLNHLLLSEIEGSFPNFDIRLTDGSGDFSDVSVEAAIYTPTIKTIHPERDKYLQLSAFFNVSKFPYIHFKSTALTKTAQRRYCLTGILSMLGVKHFIDLDVVHHGNTRNQDTGYQQAGFTVSGRLKRFDYQLASAIPAAILNNDVRVFANLEFRKA